MKAADAPPAGWYPDPEGTSRLRWWEGTDWSDHFRAAPTTAERAERAAGARASAAATGVASRVDKVTEELASLRRRDAEEIATQVRQVARNEIERAADIFTARARAATRQVEPLVSQYTSRLIRWLKIALVVAVLLLIAWFVFQAIMEVTFFDWLGERIDNLTNDNTG